MPLLFRSEADLLRTLSDELLVEQIRQGDQDAWSQLIARYEGRLLAFVNSRLSDRSSAEDIVQEAFIGFLTSLPHYDGRRALEGYLFGIAAHKLSDHLRRSGRRPTVSLSDSAQGGPPENIAGSVRHASSLVRSGERRRGEEVALAAALEEMVADWKHDGQWDRLKCMELLWVRGWGNKRVAARLGISEQSVANQKFQVVAKLRNAVASSDKSRTALSSRPAEPGDSDEILPDVSSENRSGFADAELLAYLDEALPASEMGDVEQALRSSGTLRARLAACSAYRDRGGHTVGEIWRRWRISCLSRRQLGSYLLHALEPDFEDYAAFHLTTAGCRFCCASLEDLREQQDQQPPDGRRRRQRFFQSSAGYLRGG